MYEGWNYNLWNTATGLLYWMSQPAYPSHLWQTYDYYFDMTGIYWGAKKACEPVHIQWNCYNNDVSIVNTTHENWSALRAEVETFRMTGPKYEPASGSYSNISVKSNEVVNVTNMLVPDEGHSGKISGITGTMFFLRLKLYDADDNLISQNLYWKNKSTTSHNYQALNNIPEAGVECTVLSTSVDDAGRRHLQVQLTNPASTVAFAVRMRLVDADGKRILPVIMDENYVTLMPGESQIINMEYDNRMTVGDTKILIKQYNYAETTGAIADGIMEVQDDKSSIADGSVYTVSGTRVKNANNGNMPKGIYIVNGRKIIR